MKKHLLFLLVVTCFWVHSPSAVAGAAVKEWTFLVFLNGHNNLDSYGAMNMAQMKEVGSSDQINVVVQWASLANGNTKRVFVEKNNLKVIEEFEPIDMGDYKELVKFVTWAHRNYPAKKYFIDIWNHGGGWHRIEQIGVRSIKPSDISYDDITGNKITTEDLGVALRQISKNIGQKIEVYGSDACLMSMVEVASEVSDSVKYFAGSQENEPGEGWPYNRFLARWQNQPTSNGDEITKILTEEYFSAYTGGIYGNRSVTFSALDLSFFPLLEQKISELGHDFMRLSPPALKAAAVQAGKTQRFAKADYRDLGDFIDRLGANLGPQFRPQSLAEVNMALKSTVLINRATALFPGAQGLSIWLPSTKNDWSTYGDRYQDLEFHSKTNWGKVVELLVNAK